MSIKTDARGKMAYRCDGCGKDGPPADWYVDDMSSDWLHILIDNEDATNADACSWRCVIAVAEQRQAVGA